MLANDFHLDDPMQMSRQVHARDAREADRCAPTERSPGARAQFSRHPSGDDIPAVDGNDNGLGRQPGGLARPVGVGKGFDADDPPLPDGQER
jgi:hypothetical protein